MLAFVVAGTPVSRQGRQTRSAFGSSELQELRVAVHDVPPFLREYSPDILATSSNDNVVIDVKPSSAIDYERMTRLAEAVECEPVNQPVASEIPAEETACAGLTGLSSAETLFTTGEIEAAAMLA